jgi:phage terminase small subunit
MSTRDPIPVPDGLADKTRRLWCAETASRTRSAGRLMLLEQLCHALDRAAEFRLVVERDGATSVTERTGAIHIHPLVKAEQVERALVARLAAQLGLQWSAEDGR